MKIRLLSEKAGLDFYRAVGQVEPLLSDIPKKKAKHSIKVAKKLHNVGVPEQGVYAGLLHDFLECGGDVDALKSHIDKIGLPNDIVKMVKSLSQDEDDYDDEKNVPLAHMQDVLQSVDDDEIRDLLVLVKLSDRLANLKKRSQKDKLDKKYKKKSRKLVDFLTGCYSGTKKYIKKLLRPIRDIIGESVILEETKVHYTATIAVFRKRDDVLEVLLEKRGEPPAEGEWSLPGGHVDIEGGTTEYYIEAAVRELEEETGLKVHISDMVYIAEVDSEVGRAYTDVLYGVEVPYNADAEAGSDAEKLKWTNVAETPNLAFHHNLFLESALRKMYVNTDYFKSAKHTSGRGFLVVFDGLDGSGKSSQIEKLQKHLEGRGHEVVMSKWGSSDSFKKSIKELKKKKQLSPILYCLAHAADMNYRYNTEILPALAEDKIVICDRYIYTSFARDMVRGIDDSLMGCLYTGFREPDVVFYCKCPVDITTERLQKDERMSHYGTGMDLYISPDTGDNCRAYQKMCEAQYDRIMGEVSTCCELDTNRVIDMVFDDVRKEVNDKIKDYLKK